MSETPADTPTPAIAAPSPRAAVLHGHGPWQGPPPVTAAAPQPPLFGERWIGPSAPPSRLVLAATAAGGLTAATAIPLDRAGLGWLITAVVLAGGIAVVGWRSLRSADPRPRRQDVLADAAWLLSAVALAGVGVLRDAEWLVVLCLLAACGVGSLAVVGRSFRSVIVSWVVVPVAAMRGLPWIRRGLRTARNGTAGRDLRLVVSVLVGLVLLLVFGSLLASADAAFARVLGDLLPTVEASSTTRWLFLFPLGALSMIAACFLLVAPPTPKEPRTERPTKVRGLEWAVPVGMLVALFALFVGVQFAALFGSDDYVLRTTGLTYAEYARSGFWQLLWVTALALGVIVLGLRLAPALTPIERAWKRGLLGALTCLTLVIVASALNRMWLYQQAYGFTVLRVLVLTCELWLGACFVLVMAAVLRLRASAPTRAMLAAGVAALLGLAIVNPDLLVAEQNIARGKVDGYYLSGLSADAVPALIRLPEPDRACVLGSISADLRGEDDWRSWNASRAAARDALADAPVGCTR